MNFRSIAGAVAVTFTATLLILALSTVRTSAQETVTNGQFVFDFSIGAGLRVPIEAKIVKAAPFSADIVTESIQTLADGNRIVQRSTTRFYRDSEGRVRREEDRGVNAPVISITDPVSGTSYSLDPENKIARQMPNVEALNPCRQPHRRPVPFPRPLPEMRFASSATRRCSTGGRSGPWPS